MKKITLIFSLLFSTVMFSSTSFADWTKVTKNNAATYYVDFERIRKVDGFVYYWELIDLLKPFKGVLSYKVYHQGDCKLLRHKILNFAYHKEPMGGGTGKTAIPITPEWESGPINEVLLKQVCSR